MRVCCVLAVIAFLAPYSATAQTTTADGIQALIRGDYSTAARILGPLSDDAHRPDPVARFFMATLYQWGRGVGADAVRACGLYLRAATAGSPLRVQSLAMARSIHQDLSFLSDLCALASVASLDASHDPPARSSGLEAGQRTPITRPVETQTPTAEGVDAFARGDYRRAVAILKPIAEAAGRADEVAAFFMALLYESALDASASSVRICALYERASRGPFAREVEQLFRALRESMPVEELRDCEFMQSTGFNPTFQPATFTLEPGQWIALDLRAATIMYQGTEKRFELGLAMPGVVFLPVEHTELTVGQSQLARRHFIEFFMWAPTPDMQTWTLKWRVDEVVRNEWIPIVSEDLATVLAAQPSAIPSMDVHAMAHLRINGAGDAEWAVLTGAEERSRSIASDAERQEVFRQRAAREAADALVDWTRTADLKRTPALTYSDGDGCGNVFLYGWSGDRTEAMTVQVNRNRLQLSITPRTFDIASQKTNLDVVVHVFAQPLRRFPFCSDAGGPFGQTETWKATSGTVTLELVPGVRAASPSSYRATIRIVGAEFVSPTGVRVRQAQPITLTAVVGFFGGL